MPKFKVKQISALMDRPVKYHHVRDWYAREKANRKSRRSLVGKFERLSNTELLLFHGSFREAIDAIDDSDEFHSILGVNIADAHEISKELKSVIDERRRSDPELEA